MNKESLSHQVYAMFSEALYKASEISGSEAPKDAVIIEGLRNKFGFHPERLEKQRSKVVEAIARMNPAFHTYGPNSGKGYSFLALPMLADGTHWAEHPICEMFLGLAIGLKLGGYCLPRELWDALPGSVPYLWLDNTPAKEG